jgi:hypothetical protein
MFHGGSSILAGSCAGGDPGDRHVGQGFEFRLVHEDGPEELSTQRNWFRCRNCSSMFFLAGDGNAGICITGDPHDGTGSENFHLLHDVPEEPFFQGDWRFCLNCHVLFFGPEPGGGVCVAAPVQGGPHLPQGFIFVLKHGTEFTPTSGTL